jgi:2-keto-4-pentenoate hydratase/2-oxohepta-3-ene-1,7-dioic acid hydratase in catechol pathway
MRIVSFELGGAARLGIVAGDAVVDLAVAAPELPQELGALLARGGLAAAGAAAKSAPATARRPLKDLRLLPPVGSPPKIVCLGLNYVDHAAEGGHAKPSYPSLFLRCVTSLVGHGSPILRPRCSTSLDYEAELVAVVGRRARHVPREKALDVIAGYSCFNDGSVRDYQRKTNQWTIGKNFDATGGFGPWFVTADELPPGATGLAIRSMLNGEVMQDANTRDMIFAVDETVQLLTECMTLEPGDLLVMGTPAGVGYARKPPVWMKAGDTIEIEIEKIGTLSNPIADED